MSLSGKEAYLLREAAHCWERRPRGMDMAQSTYDEFVALEEWLVDLSDDEVRMFFLFVAEAVESDGQAVYCAEGM